MRDSQVPSDFSWIFGLVDDEVARKTAKIYGITYVGSPYILVRAVMQPMITKEKVKQAINEMVFACWRCSLESYTKIMETIPFLSKI